MKRTYLSSILVLVVIMLLVWGCGGNKAQKPSGSKAVYFPSWWNTQPSNTHVCSYGLAEKVSITASMDAAKANALLEAAQYVEVEVRGMLKNYEEEAGVKDPQVLALSQKVVKAVSNARFSNVVGGKTETILATTKDGERHRTWIQLLIPRTEINKNVANQIRNEEALYNQFKASQAFQELEQSIK